jgi:hypothetical protein
MSGSRRARFAPSGRGDRGASATVSREALCFGPMPGLEHYEYEIDLGDGFVQYNTTAPLTTGSVVTAWDREGIWQLTFDSDEPTRARGTQVPVEYLSGIGPPHKPPTQ